MWYESALIATVIGTLLGFALAFIPSYLQKRQELTSLVQLLNGEIGRIVNYCKARRSEYIRYRELVSGGGLLGVYYSDRNIDAYFLANRGNMMRLDSDYAIRVARFYSYVADFKARASVLHESLRAYHAGDDSLTDRQFFVKSIDAMIDTLTSIVEEGGEILERAA